MSEGRGGFLLRQCQGVMVGFCSGSVGGRGGFPLRQCQGVVMGFRLGGVRGSWWVSA